LTLPHDRREGLFDNTAYIPFQWSPDGKWLLVQLERYETVGLGILNLSTGQVMEIEASHQRIRRIQCEFTGAAWDKDSAQTFLFFENSLPCDLGVIFPGVYANHLTSPDLTALFTFSFEVQRLKYPAYKMDGSAGTPAFRPYSDSIVFSQVTDWKFKSEYDYGEPVTRLYVMQADGTDPHPITFNTTGYTYAPVWDSTGEQLVYSSVKVENTPDGLYRSQPDGTGAQLLVPGEAWAPLSISPDNAYLVFAETNSNELDNNGGVRPLLSNGFQIFDLKKHTKYSFNDSSFIGWQMGTGPE
jgi:Tol biopolymer transport system component